MTREERKILSAIVDREVKKLTRKIIELKEFTAPIEPDCAIGRISRMDAINNKSIVETSMRNLQTRLNQLQKIAQVIDEPGYGICTQCHKPIPLGRLKIRPEIRLCADCLRT